MAADVQRRSGVQSNGGIASEFHYTACYCEENIYMLCKTLRDQGVASRDLSDLFVVFISNDRQQVPIWKQRNSSTGSDGLCVWDYHVICVQKTSGPDEALVWDLDTTLSFPAPLNLYVKEALRTDIDLDSMFSRLFRIVRASSYLRSFASDRRHMKTPDGRWRAPPPPYECIKAEDGEVHNLDEYRTIVKQQVVVQRVDEDLDKLLTDKSGLVVSEDGLTRAFACHNLRMLLYSPTELASATTSPSLLNFHRPSFDAIPRS